MAQLAVLESVSASRLVAELTFGIGSVVDDYLA